MEAVLGFVFLILVVLVVAAFGMWFAQRMAVRVGRKTPDGPRFEEIETGDGRVTSHRSPDGRFDLRTTSVEMKMSHWIERPELVEIANGRRRFQPGELWSAETVAWSDDSRSVTMQLRHYPGAAPGVTVTLDQLAGEAQVVSRAGVERMSFDEAERWLERYPKLFGT